MSPSNVLVSLFESMNFYHYDVYKIQHIVKQQDLYGMVWIWQRFERSLELNRFWQKFGIKQIIEIQIWQRISYYLLNANE